MMYNSDTDFLFPARVIPALRSKRGELWRDLVDRVSSQQPSSLDTLAFVLLMIRLGNCITCQADSFRAMQGCTACAQQTVRRFHGRDEDLVDLFDRARHEVEEYLKLEGTYV